MEVSEEGVLSLFSLGNDSKDLQCTGDLYRSSCIIPQSELAKRDAIALIRTILSALSLMGTFTIIVSVLVKKQVFSPKIHPIFMLSIADFCLALLWAAGGALWFSGGSGGVIVFSGDRDGCFAVLLTTIILEIVTVNLTCVYALLAYASIRQKDFSNVYSLFEKDLSKHVWKVWKTIAVYCFAWVEPIVVILIPFFALDQQHGLISKADNCTCWCVPYFGNVIPYAYPRDEPTKQYLYSLSQFVLSYALLVGIHYVIGFSLLLVVYGMVLARIRKMRSVHRVKSSHHNLYGATEAIIMRGQSQAKFRVIIFLTAFLLSGLFNVVLSFILVRYSISKLTSTKSHSNNSHHHHGIPQYAMVAYVMQSVTMPLQGFLNAIIYGWTREDFVQAVRTNQSSTNAVTTSPKKIPYQQRRKRRPTSPLNDSSLDASRGSMVSSPPSAANNISPPGILQALSENSDSD